MSLRPTVHANCFVVGEAGILVRGESRSGKSSLTLALIERATAEGRFARLVADDRVRLEAKNDRLIGSVPSTIAGLIERRGVGIERLPFLRRAVVRLVVDLLPPGKPLPDRVDLDVVIEGVTLPCVTWPGGCFEAADVVMTALRAIERRGDCGATALAFGRQDGEITVTMGSPSKSQPAGARAARGGRRSERNEFCAETQ
ncbi:HPr kinase/phosphatase C-terminal domain-containing protein [Chelatococcus sambhunathii]|uniref:HPr kinase/phosphatase C-terminal domain-containing protein n=1 Tax=Chelatococcus sambhunathii TaxID=363953 RepID=A0ABU1DFM2_9HYPH|nr:HPr kinase/phosphatase C-terminal domain-containing protein [Chelatococcus sambhunathii]MDR4306710.1 HPr kinase/phosphatase C-terminal domain-containing protein [Chelatococcus sambhunathii]